MPSAHRRRQECGAAMRHRFRRPYRWAKRRLHAALAAALLLHDGLIRNVPVFAVGDLDACVSAIRSGARHRGSGKHREQDD